EALRTPRGGDAGAPEPGALGEPRGKRSCGWTPPRGPAGGPAQRKPGVGGQREARPQPREAPARRATDACAKGPAPAAAAAAAAAPAGAAARSPNQRWSAARRTPLGLRRGRVQPCARGTRAPPRGARGRAAPDWRRAQLSPERSPTPTPAPPRAVGRAGDCDCDAASPASYYSDSDSSEGAAARPAAWAALEAPGQARKAAAARPAAAAEPAALAPGAQEAAGEAPQGAPAATAAATGASTAAGLHEILRRAGVACSVELLGAGSRAAPDCWRLDSRAHSPSPSERDFRKSCDALGSARERTLRSLEARWADEREGAGDGPVASAPERAARGASGGPCPARARGQAGHGAARAPAVSAPRGGATPRPRAATRASSAPPAAAARATDAGAPGGGLARAPVASARGAARDVARGAGWAPAAEASRRVRKRLGQAAAGAAGGRRAAAAGADDGAGRLGEAAWGAALPNAAEARELAFEWLAQGRWAAARALARPQGVSTRRGKLGAVQQRLVVELAGLGDAALRRVVVPRQLSAA
ncbi:unnamed protein product, partial [Prorocentrum cordatum]